MGIVFFFFVMSTGAPAERGGRVFVGQEEDEIGLVLRRFQRELLEHAVKGADGGIHHLQRHFLSLGFLSLSLSDQR